MRNIMQVIGGFEFLSRMGFALNSRLDRYLSVQKEEHLTIVDAKFLEDIEVG